MNHSLAGPSQSSRRIVRDVTPSRSLAGSNSQSAQHGPETSRFLKPKRHSLVEFIESIDKPLLIVTVALSLIGVAAIHSATVTKEAGISATGKSQLIMVAVGLVVASAVSYFDYRWLAKLKWFFFGSSVGLLMLTKVFGEITNGSRRWIDIGIRFQPSELVKILMVLFLAAWFARTPTEKLPIHRMLIPGFLTLIPFALILDQPDLGTALSIFGIYAGICLYRGMNLKLLTITGCIVLALLVGTYETWLAELEPHQQNRIRALLNPEAYASGPAYQQIQAQIAIGSGRFFGKGFQNGSQHRLSFLPEKHTDFIFAVLAEDWGFAGVLAVIGLYAALLWMTTGIMLQSRDPFGILICAGVLSMLFFQIFVNLCMMVGWAPVTGIPLPFLSYGRTSLLTTMLGVGLVLNVGRHPQ